MRSVQTTKGGGGARLATGHHEAAPFGAAEFPSPIFSYLPSLLRTTWELALRPVLSHSIVRVDTSVNLPRFGPTAENVIGDALIKNVYKD